MSRLAASSAANLANDLSHALDVAETTNAELLQRLEEAEAVIAKVRGVRDEIVSRRGGLGHIWRQEIFDSALAWVLRRLNAVDGL